MTNIEPEKDGIIIFKATIKEGYFFDFIEIFLKNEKGKFTNSIYFPLVQLPNPLMQLRAIFDKI